MPEITMDRLMTLLGSARANMQTAYKEIQHYEGAIQTLQLLIDDLRAQEIKEKHEPEEPEEPESEVDYMVEEPGLSYEGAGLA